MRCALALILVGTSANGDSRPQRVEAARQTLQKHNLADATPIDVRPELTSADAQTDGKRIEVGPSAFRDRSYLLRSVAHEMKHVRDHAVVAAQKQRVEARLAENAKLLEQTATLGDDSARERIAAKLRSNLALNQRAIENATRASSEVRAYRVGAYSLGRLGRPLGGAHFGVQHPNEDYPQKRIISAAIRGYLDGAQRSLTAQLWSLDAEARKSARAKIDAYLAGYRSELEAQGKKAETPETFKQLLKPGLRQKIDGRRAQESDMLNDASEARRAGIRDAELDLPPSARARALLR
jgi:hypothetical protein